MSHPRRRHPSHSRQYSDRPLSPPPVEHSTPSLMDDLQQQLWTLQQENEQLKRDLAEREKTEAALRESERRYAQILDSVQDMIFCKTPDSTVIYANQATCKHYGMTAEQLRGITDVPFNKLDYTQQYLQDDLRVFTTGQPVEVLEEPNVRADGTTRFFHTVKSPIFDAAGNVIELVGISRDVTERRQTELSLRTQQEQAQLVVAIAQQIRQSLDLSDILNQTVAQVHQLLAADRVLIYRVWPDGTGSAVTESVSSGWVPILGQSFPEEVFPTESQHRYQAGRILAIADVEQSELPSCLLDFVRQFHVKAKLVVPIVQGDRLWGLLVVHQCQSPRQWQSHEIDLLKHLSTQVAIAIQQAQLYHQLQHLNANLEAQVQQRTQELQQALEFESLLKRITDKVRDSLDETQILPVAVQELAQRLDLCYCNASLYQNQQQIVVAHHYGTQSCHSMTMTNCAAPVLSLVDCPDILAQLQQGINVQACRFLSTCEQVATMLICPLTDGQTFLGELLLLKRVDTVFSELEVRLVEQVANQCTIALRQSRLYQAVQAQVAELERLNRLKDDFLSTVSHELRSPMSNIKMATQMLEIGLKSVGHAIEPTSPVHRYLHILKEECHRETTLINDLLDLTRLESDSELLSLTDIDLENFIFRMAEPFADRIRNQRQQLEIIVSDSLPVVATHFSYLERIVTELLQNACKYTPPTETIKLSAHTTITGVIIQVCNSGVEIPATEHQRIFDKFYRIPKNDPWKYGGTGLGLALVKKLVEQLGGTIQVSSANNQTCFTIQFTVTPDRFECVISNPVKDPE